MIELENRSRSVFHFPVTERVKPPEGVRGKGQLRETKRVVLGDSADSDRALAGRGIAERDPKRTPSPVVRLTKEEYAELGARNHRVIEALAKKGDIVVRELAA